MSPIEIANALKVARPSLGDEAGITLYRLLRLVALEDIMGPGASAISYYAGKKLGHSLNMRNVDEFLGLCTQLKIGIVEIPEMTEEHVHVDVYECITCSGLEPVGRPLCHFEGGMITGVVESLTGKTAETNEVYCIGGLGHDRCGFSIKLRP